MNCPSLLLDNSAAYHFRVWPSFVSLKDCFRERCHNLEHLCWCSNEPQRRLGKSRTSESQCLREKGLRQSGNRKPCLPRQVGFETHRQWSLWLQDRNLAIRLKPYMRYSRSRVDERLLRLTKKHS